MKVALDNPVSPDRARVVLRKASVTGVDREARALKGLAAITRGEALGHGLWIDEAFLGQVHTAGTALAKGAKARFTHPGMSSDGMGKYLGRAKAFALDGDKVRVDLAFSAVAERSPEGDLASYCLDLAEEDPQAFGASIVFERDLKAERAFALANEVEDESLGRPRFKSPDALNTKNLPHARLKTLHAVDLVDDPAANPGGLFSAVNFSLLEGADAAASFLLGLSTDAPGDLGGVDATRARAFVARFLDQRGLEVVAKKKETSMLDEKKGEAPSQKSGALLSAVVLSLGLPTDATEASAAVALASFVKATEESKAGLGKQIGELRASFDKQAADLRLGAAKIEVDVAVQKALSAGIPLDVDTINLATKKLASTSDEDKAEGRLVLRLALAARTQQGSGKKVETADDAAAKALAAAEQEAVDDMTRANKKGA